MKIFGTGEEGEKKRKDSSRINNNNVFFIPHVAKCIVFYSSTARMIRQIKYHINGLHDLHQISSMIVRIVDSISFEFETHLPYSNPNWIYFLFSFVPYSQLWSLAYKCVEYFGTWLHVYAWLLLSSNQDARCTE